MKTTTRLSPWCSLLLPALLAHCGDDHAGPVETDSDASAETTANVDVPEPSTGTSGDNVTSATRTSTDPDQDDNTKGLPEPAETSGTTSEPGGAPGCEDAPLLPGAIAFTGSGAEGAMLSFCDGYEDSVLIEGELSIRYTDATSLAGLSCVCGATELLIENNPGLTSLSGLDLRRAPESVRIIENVSLEDVAAFELYGEAPLTLVEISHNPYLMSVEGLAGFTGFAPDATELTFRDNGALTSLHGVEQLVGEIDVLRVSEMNNITDLSPLAGIRPRTKLSIVYNDSLLKLNGLDSVTGHIDSIHIAGKSLYDLTALAAVTSANYVGIYDTVVLQKLDGLEGLTTVKDLRLANNAGLKGLDALSSLESVTDELIIESNPLLTSLSGLQKVTGEVGRIRLENNDALLELSQLASITQASFLTIDDNDSLESLDGLDGLQATLSSLRVRRNKSLSSLDALEGISEVKLSAKVIDNDALTHLSLPPLKSAYSLDVTGNDALVSIAVEGSIDNLQILTIGDNASLMSLAGLNGLVAADYLEIRDNASLTTLAGLEGLTFATIVEIEDNPALQSADSLTSIAALQGGLYLKNNPALVSLAGPGGPTFIDELRIEGSPHLESISLLSHLTDIGGDLRLVDTSLVHLDALASLETIAGALVLRGNAKLQSLGGLSSLSGALETLWLEGNPALTTLDGLEGVSEIISSLQLIDNASLQAVLDGLASLDSIGEQLIVKQNPLLPTEEAYTLRDNTTPPQWIIDGNG